MAFVDDGRAVLQREQALREVGGRTADYVDRVLVQEGIDRQEVAQLRRFGGFLAKEFKGKVLPDSQLSDYPRLVIIGDTGSGKSYVVQRAYSNAVNAFLHTSDAPFPCFLDLYKHLSSRHSIEDALDYHYPGLFRRAQKEHEPGCALFLDTLDERLSNEPNHFDFINRLLFFFEDHRESLATIVIACRRAAWNPAWFSSSDVSWAVYHADYLGFEDYAGIIPEGTARQEFFSHANALGIADLLGLPFFGFDLARKYNQGLRLPESQEEWFQEHLESALKGSIQDQEDGRAPAVEILHVLSRQLACLATFAGKPSWTIQEAVDYLGASPIFRSEYRFVSADQVRTLLQRPLFTKSRGRFSFCHQFFREYLAAEALASLPLRKQRLLLETPMPGLRDRVVTSHRGVAVFLAGKSTRFRKHLIEHDPLVGFLAELPGPASETDEQLTKAMIDEAIATHRAPWWEVSPRGERPEDHLPKHRPRDIADFVRPYLERSEEISLLWGTACVRAWEGCIDLNALLIDLAHNTELNSEIRTNAIEAVLASKEEEAIRSLYDLLESRDDRVRGFALYAYRMTEKPTPGDYIARLNGGAHDENLLCMLQAEVSSFGLLLDEEELGTAFRELESSLGASGNLEPHLVSGLFQRAVELGFDDIPPSLIVEYWVNHDFTGQLGEAVEQLIASSPGLFQRIWKYVMDELGGDNRSLQFRNLEQNLGRVCDDRIFDLIPSDRSAMNWYQGWLINGVLSAHYRKEPTAERLREFKARAPAFTGQWQLPQPKPDLPRDLLEIRWRMSKILAREQAEAHVKVHEILAEIAQELHSANRWLLKPEEVIAFLDDLSVVVRQRVLQAFEACVLESDYFCRQEDEPSSFCYTSPEYAVPFWVLWDLGTRFPVDKLDEFIRSYAFSRLGHGTKAETYFPLLDELHDLDQKRWSETIRWLIDAPHTSLYGVLEYLIARESDIYIEGCRQRLADCDFNAVDFGPLLKYWTERKPPGFEHALHSCYRCTQNEDQGTTILYTLLAEDDDQAWDELSHLIESGNPPLGSDFPPQRSLLQLPRSPSRLPTLADWFASTRRHRKDSKRPYGLDRVLLETIITIGGEAAIQQLRRLQDERAIPDVEWLSHAVFRIEDQMLSFTGDLMTPGQLIVFINREALGVVLGEHDLFEWVCQAVEDEKESIEGLGAQVAGYWNCQADEWFPKTEPQCQNVLWPALQRRLVNLGIVGVEERPIRGDRVDFWVEKPSAGGQALQVAVELKVTQRGYSRNELVAPLETQLWQQYLQPSGCQHGIYIVLWFKDDQRFPYPKTWETSGGLLEELDVLKQAIMARYPVNLACYVIAMTAPFRLH
jgi:hypothetical protein